MEKTEINIEHHHPTNDNVRSEKCSHQQSKRRTEANIIQMLANIPKPQEDNNLKQLVAEKTITKTTYTLKPAGTSKENYHTIYYRRNTR